MQRRILHFVAVLALCISPLLAGSVFVAPGVRNFQQVNEHVFRGAQPSPEGVQNLAKIGVKTVIDLRGGKDHSEGEEKMVRAAGIHYIHVPLNGFSAPSDQQIASLLALLDDSSGWPVFIHCKRGADRTGTTIACYRIAHDHWDNAKALREAKTYGMSSLERAMQHYILQFKYADVQRAGAPETPKALAKTQGNAP